MMKNPTLLHCATLLLFLPVFTNCSESGERFHDATNDFIEQPEMTEAESVHYLADMEKYKGEVMLDIEMNNQSISELKKTAMQKEKYSRLKSLEILDQLERQNNSLRMKMIDYTGDGIASWRLFKAEFSSDMKTLSNSLSILNTNNPSN